MVTIDRPQADEYGAFYAGYVARVPETDILAVLAAQAEEVRATAASVPAEREGFRYQPEKWSVRQVFGHVADAERVFGYRILCIGRGETASLPGFDELAYAGVAGHDRVPLARLVELFASARLANLEMMRDLDEVAWRRRGTANAQPVTTRAIAYILAGHARHHLHVLQERYAVPSAAAANPR